MVDTVVCKSLEPALISLNVSSMEAEFLAIIQTKVPNSTSVVFTYNKPVKEPVLKCIFR